MGKIDPKAKKTAKPEPAKGKQAPAPSKALATVPKAEPPAVKPSMAAMLEEDAGNNQGMNRDDLAIPRLQILQALSPQVNTRDDGHVEGAEVGMIINNVDESLYDGQEGFLALVIAYRKAHLEWWPRDSKKGKGFVKDHGPDPAILLQTTRNDKGQNLTKDGTEIVPTGEYFIFILDEKQGTYEQALVSMAKTQLSKSKKLNTMMSTFMVDTAKGRKVAPFFYRTYKFATKPESNDKGNWFGWDITPGPTIDTLPNGESIYADARAFLKNVEAGKVKVADPVADGDAGGGHAEGDDSPM